MAVTKQRARRDPGSGSVFEREITKPNGKKITRYVGIINLGDDVNGKRRRKTIYGTSRQDVKEKLVRLTRELAERGDLPTSDITVGKWLSYWLESIAAERLKPATLTGYRTVVNQRLIPALGKHRLEKLGTSHVREMHKSITAAGLSSTTALNAHRVLSAALNDAVREGRVGRNVASLVRAPTKEISTRSNLTAEQAVKVLTAAAADQQNGTTWLAAFLLGVRQGERLGLRWEFVDFDAGTIDVAWSLQRTSWAHGCADLVGHHAKFCPQRKAEIPDGMEHIPIEANYVLLRPKTERSRRIIPLPDIVLLPLRRRYEGIAMERALYDVDHDLVWCRPDGGPIKPRDDWQTWRDLLAATGSPMVTLHEARHTTATLLFELGVDRLVINAILGHSTAIDPLIYTHVSTTLAREALNDLGRRLELPAASPGSAAGA